MSETLAAMFIFFLSYLFTGSMPGARNSFEIREFFYRRRMHCAYKLDGWEEIVSFIFFQSGFHLGRRFLHSDIYIYARDFRLAAYVFRGHFGDHVSGQIPDSE